MGGKSSVRVMSDIRQETNVTFAPFSCFVFAFLLAQIFSAPCHRLLCRYRYCLYPLLCRYRYCPFVVQHGAAAAVQLKLQKSMRLDNSGNKNVKSTLHQHIALSTRKPPSPATLCTTTTFRETAESLALLILFTAASCTNAATLGSLTR